MSHLNPTFPLLDLCIPNVTHSLNLYHQNPKLMTLETCWPLEPHFFNDINKHGWITQHYFTQSIHPFKSWVHIFKPTTWCSWTNIQWMSKVNCLCLDGCALFIQYFKRNLKFDYLGSNTLRIQFFWNLQFFI